MLKLLFFYALGVFCMNIWLAIGYKLHPEEAVRDLSLSNNLLDKEGYYLLSFLYSLIWPLYPAAGILYLLVKGFTVTYFFLIDCICKLILMFSKRNK